MAERLARWWHHPDHYYWMTAYLAAHGVQPVVCRLIAAMTTFLGLVPLAMLASPSGPQDTFGRAASVVITISCLVMSTCWLRPLWPSRRTSIAFVVVASLLIALVCLTGGDVVANATAGAAFAILGAYAAYFHGARMVLVNLVVTVVTVAITATELAQQRDLMFGLCTGLFIIGVNIAVPVVCQTLVGMLDLGALGDDIDTVTGLLNKEAFYLQASELIGARNRGDDRYLVIAVTTLDHFRLLRETTGKVATDRARVAVGQTLRDVTRRDAVVAHVGEEEFLIADTFQTTDVSPLVNRVRSAIATTPPKLTASVGVVSTPMKGLADTPYHVVLDEMVTIATVAMFDARLAGGDQVRYVECPPLRALDD